MLSPEVLRRFGCFATSRAESLKELAMMAEEIRVPAGACLFQEGSPADKLSLIVEGSVDIQYALPSGELRTVDTLIAGDLLGWSALIEPYRMTGTATVASETRLIVVDAPRLRALCDRDPQLGYHLTIQAIKLLADRLEGARVQLAAV